MIIYGWSFCGFVLELHAQRAPPVRKAFGPASAGKRSRPDEGRKARSFLAPGDAGTKPGSAVGRTRVAESLRSVPFTPLGATQHPYFDARKTTCRQMPLLAYFGPPPSPLRGCTGSGSCSPPSCRTVSRPPLPASQGKGRGRRIRESVRRACMQAVPPSALDMTPFSISSSKDVVRWFASVRQALCSPTRRVILTS